MVIAFNLPILSGDKILKLNFCRITKLSSLSGCITASGLRANEATSLYNKLPIKKSGHKIIKNERKMIGTINKRLSSSSASQRGNWGPLLIVSEKLLTYKILNSLSNTIFRPLCHYALKFRSNVLYM